LLGQRAGGGGKNGRLEDNLRISASTNVLSAGQERGEAEGGITLVYRSLLILLRGHDTLVIQALALTVFRVHLLQYYLKIDLK